MATTDGVDSNNANLEKTRELIEQGIRKELENLASGYVERTGQGRCIGAAEMNELTPVRAAVMEFAGRREGRGGVPELS